MIDDDNYELASAYSDGELDTAQRAVVEQDPALLAVASQITAMRATLTAAPETLAASFQPDADTKARHLSMAGAAFDEIYAPSAAQGVSAGAATASSAQVIDLRSRKRYRVLTMAAGFIVVAGVGVVAISSLQGSSSDDSFTSSAELADAAIEDTEAKMSNDVTIASDTEVADEMSGQENGAQASAMAEPEAEMDTAEDAADDAAEEAAPVVETTEASDSPSSDAEPTHFFDAEATLDEIFDTIIADRTEPIESACASDLFPPTFEIGTYVIELDGQLLHVLVGTDTLATTVLLVNDECQALDQLERPAE